MKTLLEIFLPQKADNTLVGSQWPFYLLVLVVIVGTVRSCIHIFAPDGGAGSIAGMNLNGTGANEVIFAFALWGSEQLIYALLQWVVILRYRSLVPLMWFIQLLEVLGRMLVGYLKPVSFSHTPPGANGNYIILVLSIFMLILTFWTGMNTTRENPQKGTVSQ